MPLHLRNLGAQQSERAAQLMRGGEPAASTTGSAVASYFEHLSDAGGNDET